MLCGEFTNELASSLPLSQLLTNHLREQLLSLDQRNLYVSVRVAIQRQLTSYALGKRSIQLRVLLCQLADDVSTLLALLDHLELSVMLSQEVVQLSDQTLHCRNELDQALRDQHRTEVVTLSGTLSHDVGDISHDLIQRHVLCLNLLRDDADVRLCLQGALQSDVRSGTTHQLDEVPVFLCGVTIALDVTDHL